jgi:acyl carrier protein
MTATYEVVEPHIRRLVAEHLGVGLDTLVPHVSLRDDLAADSLDLVDLILAIETSLKIVISQRTLDAVRSYDDLVHASIGLIRARSC